MKTFKCHKSLMKVIEKYIATDDDKGDCGHCPFSMVFFKVAFPESKYNQQYQDLVDNKSYSVPLELFYLIDIMEQISASLVKAPLFY